MNRLTWTIHLSEVAYWSMLSFSPTQRPQPTYPCLEQVLRVTAPCTACIRAYHNIFWLYDYLIFWRLFWTFLILKSHEFFANFKHLNPSIEFGDTFNRCSITLSTLLLLCLCMEINVTTIKLFKTMLWHCVCQNIWRRYFHTPFRKSSPSSHFFLYQIVARVSSYRNLTFVFY